MPGPSPWDGVTLSVSTWQQPMPPPPSAARAKVLEAMARRVLDAGGGRLRVAVDGPTGAGKTSLGHELAHRVARTGRPVLRACLDDFKRPWQDRHRYDRTSGEGYYRNAFDTDAVRRLLLDPFGSGGDGRVALCSIDPLTQLDHSTTVLAAPADAVLVVDGVFAFRPELADHWDVRVRVVVPPEVALRRGVERDASREGRASAEAVHRDRYAAAERCYEAEVGPDSLADVLVDNTDLDHPRILRR